MSAATVNAASAPVALSLDDAVAIAMRQSPLATVARYEVDTAKAEIEEVFGTFVSPEFEALSYGGLISDARGDSTYSPDTGSDYSDLGPFFTIDLKIIQPLYTFGKYSTAMEAANSNLLHKEASYESAKNDIAYEVAKAYFGVLAGEEGSDIGRELTDQYRRLLDSMEERLNANDPEIDASHLLEAKTMHFEIKKLASTPFFDRKKALLYLKGLLHYGQDVTLQPITAPRPPAFEDSPELLDKLLAYFKQHSPVLASMDAGLLALRKLSDLEEKKRYPDLFLAVGLGYGTAPGRDEQDNPFVGDDYNYEKFGGVLGLKWDFNFHKNFAREEKALLEYQRQEQQRQLAVTHKDGEIRKSYEEAARNLLLYQASLSSLKSAKSWLRLEHDNQELGIGDTKRFVQAYRTYFTLKRDEINSKYQYLLSLAQLARTTGDMNLFLNWINDGQVQLH